MPRSLSVSCLTLLLSWILAAQALCTDDRDAPANSTLACNESFDAPLDEKWHSNAGEWKVVDGVLRARELEADKHAAVTRRTLETTNAVYDLNFRLTGNARAFHFGFDPAKGELRKKGHLFSVIVTPENWKILKHVDKDRREEDPNETLTSEDLIFEKGKWYKLRVVTWGRYVSATIDRTHKLKTSHPSFGVRKPALVFRCSGDGVEIDNVRVWKQKGR